jgi:hypothetical protein
MTQPCSQRLLLADLAVVVAVRSAHDRVDMIAETERGLHLPLPMPAKEARIVLPS